MILQDSCWNVIEPLLAGKGPDDFVITRTNKKCVRSYLQSLAGFSQEGGHAGLAVP
jgi:hypothetical protein